RYRIASPNEAFIITGGRGRTAGDLSGQKVVTGSGVFVVPLLQTRWVMDLSARRINIQIRGAVSQLGVKLNVEGIAIVKVGGDEQSIRAAAQRFLTQQDQVEGFATEVLAGALRSIVGTLTVEEIIRDRASFAAQVAEVTESALTGQGLVLDTFQIQDITDFDNGTYLRDMGRPEQAKIAEAAAIQEAKSLQAQEQARLAAEGEVLTATRELEIKRSTVRSETDAAAATAAAAGPLAAAVKEREVLAEREQVAVAQSLLTERELETSVRKPADAERYRVEQEAEGRRTSTIAAAQAKAEEAELVGRGELARRTAFAHAVQAEGEAQAASLKAIGQAEAGAMQAKADAYKEYGDAAVLETVLAALPGIAAEIARPMASIDNLTVVSTEGASAVSRSVTDTFAQLQALLATTAGVDLSAILRRLEAKDPKTIAALAEASRGSNKAPAEASATEA
ncbi:MAG: SPFH domain-containing protein, partial [bacterium]|nr:SPFH domain-containing protein [bacterium]